MTTLYSDKYLIMTVATCHCKVRWTNYLVTTLNSDNASIVTTVLHLTATQYFHVSCILIVTNVYSLFHPLFSHVSSLSLLFPFSPSPSSLLFSPLPTQLQSSPFATFLPIYFLFPPFPSFAPLSLFSTFLLSFLPFSSFLSWQEIQRSRDHISSINKCHCKEITICHYMVCKTHFLMTAPFSDMSLYSPCHYLVLSLYSAGIGNLSSLLST